ncbi:MAG: aminotransferase class I/II-fold pyridoxal phosphate-dependent enzyme, partial [Gemmatimonadetes bacterium]|nr:aminotransferase class I/II-fold pyridoxal phosphate-dependent enzyme [Gemmatimonadota bacterium]NIU53891.1 aminotransferase class I/II-fold pyridoxal phosphate-dependent enzyme [Gemmatimonadota bacterium]NIV24064.1 aminotransferase class I/II-fold pyridoxal phosphate-dependent enzyme [Gemmatimonadota bacterium]NIW37855.1 aminotransferase class I/II-fold pyridoxal phosphate-dependent enzyme [Gemmatimonadota bacterium]NIY45527.1 aminotransferase class I/II-fold pyridoxal phosphate-dependent e
MTANDIVDLRSDTVTRPSPGMRQAIAEAEVGDDVLGDDPTVKRLQERLAELLGKEASLFFPSGTQANQTAVLLHTLPGSEALCEANAHVLHYEFAGAAAWSGVQLRPVPTEDGVLTAELARPFVRPENPHLMRTSLICAENTHNMAGGKVMPLEVLEGLRELADEHGIPLHLDGARLWNASAATGLAPAELAAPADTVMVSFSKGLGAPIGSALAGTAEAMERAHRWRKRLGGGMRQVGILAAAGLYALEHNLDRLADDHARARRLAEHVDGLDGFQVVPPDTNIIMIDVERDDVSPAEIV